MKTFLIIHRILETQKQTSTWVKTDMPIHTCNQVKLRKNKIIMRNIESGCRSEKTQVPKDIDLHIPGLHRRFVFQKMEEKWNGRQMTDDSAL